ncbi:hypothetical protein HGRIS_011448 [Hohenbuehelia grisea]|uniref:PIN-like protein n=1 Tax=Hohenbuehelia grisea TaxID=104357 RepID=A0ABR3JXA2_9AGAR
MGFIDGSPILQAASPSMETPVWPLLRTVVASIIEVFLLCLAGYILAGQGILDKKTQKQLNKLNVSLFTPCLLFSKVAFFLSPAKLRELWIIPIFFVVTTVVSMAIAFVLGTIFRLKRSQRSFGMAAAMFMNSNSLPIALMQSLVVTVPSLKWGEHDNKNAMLGRALTYLVLYSTLGMVLRWSYGVKLLAQADDEINPSSSEIDEHSPLLDHQEPSPTLFSHEPDSQISLDEPESPLPIIVAQQHTNTLRPPRPRPRRQTTFYKSFPNSPNRSQVQLPPIESRAPSITGGSISSRSSSPTSEISGDETARDAGLPLHISRRRTQRDHGPDHENGQLHPHQHHRDAQAAWRVFLRRGRRRFVRFWTAFNDFMTVPLWAALASIIVACAQPLQHALNVHLQPLKHALSSGGNCSIPLTLVVLGAYFHPGPKHQNDDESRNGGIGNGGIDTSRSTTSLLNSVKEMFGARKGVGSRSSRVRARKEQASRAGETKTVVIAVLSRMVLTPLCLLPLMALSTKFDLQTVFDDPVFVVANVLLISSPPALTLAQITQAASGDAFERLISRTIFWAYCVVTPPATIAYVVIGLVLAKL